MSTSPVPRQRKPSNRPLRSRAWMDRAQRAVQEDAPPTWSLDLRSVQDGVGEQRSRAVIDLAMRIADSMLSTGASAADVTATVLRLTDTYGLRSVHVDVTFTSIAVSHHRGSDEPVTIIRTVHARSADYERLARLQAFVRDLEADPVDPAEARARFDAIVGRPRLYRRALVTVASALLAAAVCTLLDGSTAEILIALLNAVVVDRVQLWLSRRRVAAFFSQLVGGAVPTLVAILLITARAQDVPGLGEVEASAVVAAGIVLLLAGLSVVGAAQDAIDGYYLTAVARSFEVVVLTLGIIVGVLLVLGAAQRLGAPSYLASAAEFVPSFPVQVFSAAVIAGAFAVSAYSGPRTVLVCVLTGVIGWLAYAVSVLAGFGSVTACGAAAFVVGVLAQVLAGRWNVPSLALSTAGIVSLLPGLAVYRGLYQLTTSSSIGGLGPSMISLGAAAAAGLALAAGASLGSFLGRSLRGRGANTGNRAVRRALRRAAADGRE